MSFIFWSSAPGRRPPLRSASREIAAALRLVGVAGTFGRAEQPGVGEVVAGRVLFVDGASSPMSAGIADLHLVGAANWCRRRRCRILALESSYR